MVNGTLGAASWRLIMKKLRQTKGKSKWTALCLAAVTAVSLIGCGGPGAGDGTAQKDNIPGSEGENDAVAMGRYVESVSEVDVGQVMDLRELSDGQLVLLEDGAVGRMVSADGGTTWEEDMLPGWYDLLEAGNYMADMKVSPDGSVALLCRNYKGGFSGQENQEEEGQTEAGDGEEGNSSYITMDMPESEFGIYLISPEGETRWVQMSLNEEEYLESICFSEDGSRLFAASDEGRIYEIDRNAGTKQLFMTVDIIPNTFCVWENYMAVKSESEGVWLYDLDTQKRIVDDVLSDFVAQNCQGDNRTVLSTYTVFPAEEGSLYLVCDKGVYRHAIGGAVMEQVINGGLSSFSDPTIHVAKMICAKEDGFLAAFSEGRISTFTYDPNISTTPSQRMVAYSLTECTILRQAIIRYQGKHPDVYVEYKVGMDEEGGVTREDAVKKLNAEIMAGKGPDFLILDGLPVDSYINKGVLADISPYLTELEKEEKILPNIKESFTKDDRICVIPAAIMLSMYMTDEKNMTGVSDLSSLADAVENLRSLHPGEEIIEICNEDILLNALMPVSAPLWLTESGQLNTEELADYLEQAKRIYDACMDGLPKSVLEKYLQKTEEPNSVASSDEVSAYNELQGGGIQIVSGSVQMSVGTLRNAYNYAFLQSLKKTEQGKDCQAALLPGSVKDAYTPVALMGINAVSGQADLAGELLQEVLSREMQSMLFPAGFPVNEAGLSDYLESLGGMVPKERQIPGEVFGGYGFSSDFSGSEEIIVLEMYVPTSQENQVLYEMLTSVRTPYLSDTVMEEAVREAGRRYLEGRCSLEEAVEVIQKKIEIYMAE